MKKLIKLTVLTVLLFLNKNIVKAADYIWPIDTKNAYETYIEYGYGQRTYDSKAYDIKFPGGQLEGYYSKSENHYGVDITGIKGHTYDVISVADGTVLTTSLDQLWNPSLNHIDRNQRNISYDGGGYGNYIVIKEDKTGKCFLYGHLKANSVTLRNGNKVKKGEKIGVMGSSGDSGHMHLHFEVRPNQNYTTTGKNLVITTKYGLETLNPINYIGTKAPEKPIVENKQEKQPELIENKKEEVKQDNKEENKQINTPLQVTNIEFTDYKTFGKISITFNKETKEKPIIIVMVEETQGNYASFISKANNTYTYTVKYDKYDITTFGNIKLDISVPDELTNYMSATIGYLNEYMVPQTYEEAYYYRQGDLNKDGKVDSVDASLALRIYSKLGSDTPLTPQEEDQKTRADMNKDGYINSIDASLILKYYTNKSTYLTDEKQEKIITCDLTGDHVINSTDYKALITDIENSKQNNVYNGKYDLNNDGILNNKDEEFFLSVLKEFGKR